MWNDTHRRIRDPLSFLVPGVSFMLEGSPRRCLILRLRPPPEVQPGGPSPNTISIINILPFLLCSSRPRLFVADSVVKEKVFVRFRPAPVRLPEPEREGATNRTLSYSRVLSEKKRFSAFSVRIFPSVRYIKIISYVGTFRFSGDASETFSACL